MSRASDCLGLVCLVFGCSKTEPPAPQTKATEASGSAAEVDRQLGDKLDLYIGECLNRFSGAIVDSQVRYYAWADEAAGITGKEQNVQGLGPIKNPGACVAWIEKANEKPPEHPRLETAASAYARALEAAYPIISKAAAYYDDRAYARDDFAQGKAMHPQLVATFAGFAAVEREFRSALSEASDALELRELALIERTEGKSYAWHLRTLARTARHVEALAHDVPWEKIPLETLKPAADKLETAVTSLATLAQQKELPLLTGAAIRAATRYVESVKELARRIEARTPYAAGELPLIGTADEHTVNGSPSQVVARYNELVDALNTL
jgi:hypothetical protein